MKRKLIVITASLLFIVAAYVGFYFFKTNQVTRQINTFVTKKANKISVGKITVYGFPLLNKVKIEDVKLLRTGGRDSLSVSKINLEVKNNLSNIIINFPEPFVSKDAAGNISGYTNFPTKAALNIFISGDEISRIKFINPDYVIMDSAKNPNFTSQSKSSEIEILIGKEIKLKYGAIEPKILDKNNNTIFAADSSLWELAATIDDKTKNPTNFLLNIELKNYEHNNFLNTLEEKVPLISMASSMLDLKQGSGAVEEGKKSEVASDKSNFALAFEISATPVLQQAASSIGLNEDFAAPKAANKMSFSNSMLSGILDQNPYSLSLNLKKLEFSNSIYNFSLNGGVKSNAPKRGDMSGLITLKIKNLDYLLNEYLDKISDFTDQPLDGLAVKDKNASAEKIKKINLFIKDLATKNTLSKDDISVFDFRIDSKNNFAINNVSDAEVMAGITPQRDPGKLILWFDASSKKAFDEKESKNGARVTNWYDSISQYSLKASQLAPANKPVYIKNAINKLPALKFDGKSSSLVTKSIIGNSSEIFMVLKTDEAATSQSANQSFKAAILWPSKTVKILTWKTAIKDNLAHIVRVTRDSESGLRAIYIDGKMTGQDYFAASFPLVAEDNMVIGGSEFEKEYYNAYISEIMVYDRSLDDKQAQLIEKDLGKKWNIAN